LQYVFRRGASFITYRKVLIVGEEILTVII
jgi:hypothetical protein